VKRSRTTLAFLVALMAIVRLPAAANDNVSIGMVRLPTAVFVAMDRGYFAAEGLNVTPVFSQSAESSFPRSRPAASTLRSPHPGPRCSTRSRSA